MRCSLTPALYPPFSTRVLCAGSSSGTMIRECRRRPSGRVAPHPPLHERPSSLPLRWACRADHAQRRVARPAVARRPASPSLLPRAARRLCPSPCATPPIPAVRDSWAARLPTTIGREVLAALRARGDASAEAETTLSDLAAWYYRELLAGRSPSSPQSEQAAARLGFVGALHAASAFPVDAVAGTVPPWREVLSELVRNVSVNRFGVWAAPDGGTAVVVFAAVELTLEPFPRHLARRGTLRLRGHIAPRFTRGVVYLTTASGAVEQTPLADRTLDVTLRVGPPGVYRLEVMGDGPSGPVVLGNVPVYVDTEEPALEGISAGPVAPPGGLSDARRTHDDLAQSGPACGRRAPRGRGSRAGGGRAGLQPRDGGGAFLRSRLARDRHGGRPGSPRGDRRLGRGRERVTGRIARGSAPGPDGQPWSPRQHARREVHACRHRGCARPTPSHRCWPPSCLRGGRTPRG